VNFKRLPLTKRTRRREAVTSFNHHAHKKKQRQSPKSRTLSTTNDNNYHDALPGYLPLLGGDRSSKWGTSCGPCRAIADTDVVVESLCSFTCQTVLDHISLTASLLALSHSLLPLSLPLSINLLHLLILPSLFHYQSPLHLRTLSARRFIINHPSCPALHHETVDIGQAWPCLRVRLSRSVMPASAAKGHQHEGANGICPRRRA
jgi:hypothetical protein